MSICASIGSARIQIILDNVFSLENFAILKEFGPIFEMSITNCEYVLTKNYEWSPIGLLKLSEIICVHLEFFLGLYDRDHSEKFSIWVWESDGSNFEPANLQIVYNGFVENKTIFQNPVKPNVKNRVTS